MGENEQVLFRAFLPITCFAFALKCFSLNNTGNISLFPANPPSKNLLLLKHYIWLPLKNLVVFNTIRTVYPEVLSQKPAATSNPRV